MKGKDFYVYVLYRPWDGTPCYVGKGTGGRWLQHAQRGARHQNIKLAAIYKRASRLGLVVLKKKRYRGLTEREAFALEILLIKKYGRLCSGGLLVNLTAGGDGLAGHIFSKQHKANLSVALRGRILPKDVRDKMSKAHTGKVFSDQHKRRLCKAAVGKKMSTQAKAAMRRARLLFWQDPANRKRMRTAHSGKQASIQTRNKMAASQRARWAASRALGGDKGPFSL